MCETQWALQSPINYASIIQILMKTGEKMEKSFKKMLNGYQKFREKYASSDDSIMERLADYGQKPEILVVSCCDSRVDPALILQCQPGDLFITRNVANIVPPYESDERHHGTSAALEFGVCYLNVKHIIILGHSQCGGINALLSEEPLPQDDFISNWVSQIKLSTKEHDCTSMAQSSLNLSYQHCLTFPWIKERLEQGKLAIHRWYFDIKAGEIFAYSNESGAFEKLE